jgi:hypothetical protein
MENLLAGLAVPTIAVVVAACLGTVLYIIECITKPVVKPELVNTVTREPKYMGSGIFMYTYKLPTLVKGDTCWDADCGNLIWDGKEWVQTNK